MFMEMKTVVTERDRHCPSELVDKNETIFLMKKDLKNKGQVPLELSPFLMQDNIFCQLGTTLKNGKF